MTPWRIAIIVTAVVMLPGGCAAPRASTRPVMGETTAADARTPPSARTMPEERPPAEARLVQPFPGVRVNTVEGVVEIDAVVCLDSGWLEQIACTANTREHEALVVVSARPSHVHAALLMAGFEPGRPGRWTFTDDVLEFIEPRGTPLDVGVRVETEAGAREHDVRAWIRDHLGRQQFPDAPWVFAGSRFVPDGRGGERYAADDSGSVIGLVTFGDEVLGFSKVLADAAQVQAPEWEVDPERIPPVGTPVTVVIRADQPHP